MPFRHPKYDLGTMVIIPAKKIVGVVNGYDLLNEQYTIRVLSYEGQSPGSNDFCICKECNITPASELGKAIFT